MSKVLKIAREFHQLSQQQVAEALGVSKSNVSEYESGKRALSLQTIRRYAKLFGIPASSLLSFMEEIDNQYFPSEHGQLQANALKLFEWLQAKIQLKGEDENNSTPTEK